MTSANWSAAQNQKMLSEFWKKHLELRSVCTYLSVCSVRTFCVLIVRPFGVRICTFRVGFRFLGGKLQFGSLDGDLGHHRHIFQSRISGAEGLF